MHTTYHKSFECYSWLKKQKATIGALALLVCISAMLLSAPAAAQGGFDSGSTGADGAFTPTTSQTVQLPASGVFNFTTVNIPSGVTIKFNRNANNTPVTILTTGSVTIAGTIDVSGQDGASNGPATGGGAGGPGGFDGGRGGYPAAAVSSGISGDGPGGGGGGGKTGVGNAAAGGGGGGYADVGSDGVNYSGGVVGKGGQRYGSNILLPLVGGSGGGGGASFGGVGATGGGGGGAILIASSGAITFNNGSLLAKGGRGGPTNPNGSNPGAGGGSGGAIRLVANTISGPVSLFMDGGGSLASFGASGGPGYVRVEAFTFSSFNPVISPTGQQSFSSFGLPSSVILSNAPTLKIASVAGIAAPAMPAGSFHAPADIVVPSSQTNPVTAALQATNIPLGTIVQVTLTPEIGAFTNVQSTPLAGTVAASTATASINLPTTGMSVINATTSYDLPSGNRRVGQLLIDGERVKRVEVATSFGGQSEVSYITESGKRIKHTGE
jgi:hypothetical protein